MNKRQRFKRWKKEYQRDKNGRFLYSFQTWLLVTGRQKVKWWDPWRQLRIGSLDWSGADSLPDIVTFKIYGRLTDSVVITEVD